MISDGKVKLGGWDAPLAPELPPESSAPPHLPATNASSSNTTVRWAREIALSLLAASLGFAVVSYAVASMGAFRPGLAAPVTSGR